MILYKTLYRLDKYLYKENITVENTRTSVGLSVMLQDRTFITSVVRDESARICIVHTSSAIANYVN